VDYLCNGSNDAAQINAAIAALGSRGGTIRLLEGAYNINDTIRLNKNYVTLEGMGRESTTILKSASVVGIEITAMDAKLKDLSLYGNGYSGNGIYCSTALIYNHTGYIYCYTSSGYTTYTKVAGSNAPNA
jgi:hypothetical protein